MNKFAQLPFLNNEIVEITSFDIINPPVYDIDSIQSMFISATTINISFISNNKKHDVTISQYPTFWIVSNLTPMVTNITETIIHKGKFKFYDSYEEAIVDNIK